MRAQVHAAFELAVIKIGNEATARASAKALLPRRHTTETVHPYTPHAHILPEQSMPAG